MIPKKINTAIAGAASAVTIPAIGFRARKVVVVNMSTAGSLEWKEGMPDASGIKVVTGGAQTVITSNGITVNADTSITIGTDATNAAPTVTTTATGAKASKLITVASATGLAKGQVLVGTGIPAGTKIVSVVGTTVELERPLTQAISASAVAVANLLVEIE